MEDEKRRSEVLFGDKFNQLTAAGGTTAVAPAVVPVVVQPAPVVAPTVNVESKEDVKGEVRAALAEMNEQKKTEKKSYYSVIGGMGDYPDVPNIQGQYSLGFAMGQKINDRMLVEGSFLYSNYLVQQRDSYTPNGYSCFGTGPGCFPRITEMNQYNLSAVVKYHILPGTFRPVIGGLAEYTYRTYSDTQFAISNNDASSHAINLGAILGADVEASDTLAIGLEFRYIWNLTYRASSDHLIQNISQSVYGNDKPIETLGQMQINLMARMTF